MCSLLIRKHDRLPLLDLLPVYMQHDKSRSVDYNVISGHDAARLSTPVDPGYVSTLTLRE